jgi:hypothetical protein
MARHLTQDDVKKIVNMLHKWSYELTWDLLVDACKNQLDIMTTRQALNRKQEIKETFGLTKKRLKVKGQNYVRPNSINVAHHRIEALANELNALRNANNFLIQKFVKWEYNALNRGMTLEELERPLPQQDHGNLRNIKG